MNDNNIQQTEQYLDSDTKQGVDKYVLDLDEYAKMTIEELISLRDDAEQDQTLEDEEKMIAMVSLGNAIRDAIQNDKEFDEYGIRKKVEGLSTAQNKVRYLTARIHAMHPDLYAKEGEYLWHKNKPIRRGPGITVDLVDLADTLVELTAIQATMVYRGLLKKVEVKSRAKSKISSTLSWDAENLNMVRHRKRVFDRRPAKKLKEAKI